MSLEALGAAVAAALGVAGLLVGWDAKTGELGPFLTGAVLASAATAFVVAWCLAGLLPAAFPPAHR